MRKISITITEETLREHFEDLANKAEENHAIAFPSSEERKDFIEDCTQCALDDMENYDSNPILIYDTCEEQLFDMATLYGYTID